MNDSVTLDPTEVGMNYTLDDLRSSFSLLDYRSDHGESVPSIAATLGVNIDDLMHVAEQRGMRAALVATGERDKLDAVLSAGRPMPVRLTAEQQEIMAWAAGTVMDTVAATLLMVQKADDEPS